MPVPAVLSQGLYGAARSPTKVLAARENGRKRGRPRKVVEYAQ